MLKGILRFLESVVCLFVCLFASKDVGNDEILKISPSLFLPVFRMLPELQWKGERSTRKRLEGGWRFLESAVCLFASKDGGNNEILKKYLPY